MRNPMRLAALALFASSMLCANASAQETPRDKPGQAAPQANKPDSLLSGSPDEGVLFHADSSTTDGEVTVGGKTIPYRAVAGTLVVHPKGWNDAAWREKQEDKDLGDKGGAQAEASMFYVAYFKKGVPSADRPITFLYNGGPGSSTVWLHMGAFGPRRVVTADDTHTHAAPYQLVDNAYSLLDVTDVVFIDAPGTGFSRIAGKDAQKAFYGVDPDAYAFSQFIQSFLSKYDRWNSPKYLFGESYGTPRSANVANLLETDNNIDLNGVILLSQILNFDLSVDGPEYNPGSDGAYVVALPTYAATAWYHNRIPGGRPAQLEPFLSQVEQFAQGEYASALQQGDELDPARRQAVAEKLAQYTGLPVSYILRANLRVDGGEFEKTLQGDDDLTTGRLDTRFSGPSMDPLSKEAEYDPQSASIGSAYVAAFNSYVRDTLHYGYGRTYKPEIDMGDAWNMNHTPPGASSPVFGITNLMPDMASAMKYNPNLKVMVNGGYYDLATPFYEGWYEMHHLPIPKMLEGNLEYHYYPSGHMVYAHEESLKTLHENVADFIRRTDNLGH